jgi:hypothetical protein
MDTNLSLDKEITLLELESKIEGHQLKRKQIQIEKMRIQRRITDLDEAIVGVDASIATAQAELDAVKTSE